MAITNSLRSFIVDGEQKENLDMYETKKFSELHNEILLDKGMPNLIRKVQQAKNELENKMEMSTSHKGSSISPYSNKNIVQRQRSNISSTISKPRNFKKEQETVLKRTES